jgi:hypothetical protein
MKLEELHPVIESKKILVIDCPCGTGHRIPLPIGEGKDEWTMKGKLENLSLEPSIEVGCWSGFIKDGKVVKA